MTFEKFGFGLEDYLTKELGLSLERGGRYVCCPLHDENTASFRLYDDDTFYCFGCDKGGDVVVLHRELANKEGRSLNYRGALNEVRHIVYKYTKNPDVLKDDYNNRPEREDYVLDGNRVVARKKVKEDAETVVEPTAETLMTATTTLKKVSEPKKVDKMAIARAVTELKDNIRIGASDNAQRLLFDIEAMYD